jgi:predicted KAP-like P-loop ATPase
MQQAFPRHAWRPSRTAIAAMRTAATGFAHDQPRAAFASKPSSSTPERYVRNISGSESATAEVHTCADDRDRCTFPCWVGRSDARLSSAVHLDQLGDGMKSDDPIYSRSEDRLDRGGFADHLTTALLALPAERGVVVGLMGPWGVGKTSVVNMVVENLAGRGDRTVLEFNPWMFSSGEQLVSLFFDQLAAQFRLKRPDLDQAADWLEDYGQALTAFAAIPGPGSLISATGTMMRGTGGLLRRRRKNKDPVVNKRDRIVGALQQMEQPIIVVVDDVDRLTSSEIRDVFRLVRLTAHFPKVIYLVVFDRNRVEDALEDDTGDGRAYLDKIVQVPIDMPQVSRLSLEALLLEGLDEVTAMVMNEPVDPVRWSSVFQQAIFPLFHTVRDVSRYLAVLPAMLATVNREVALVDVLALEALRVRQPDVFARLPAMTATLTGAGMQIPDGNARQAQIEELIAGAGNQAQAVQDFCRLLFPAAQRYLGGSHYGSGAIGDWRRDRRVANEDVLEIYLNRALRSDTVPVDTVDTAVAALGDRQALSELLDCLEEPALTDLLVRLAVYEEDLAAQVVEAACAALMPLYQRRRPKREVRLLDLTPDYALDRLILRLLQRLADRAERVRIVEAICSDQGTFTGRIRLLEGLGRQANFTADRLIPADDVDRLYRDLCREVRHGSSTAILAERDPLDLLAKAINDDPGDRDDIDAILANDASAAALLTSALITLPRQVIGGHGTDPFFDLRWESVATVVGDNDAVGALVSRLRDRAKSDADLLHAVDLATDYAQGRAPKGLPRTARPIVARAAPTSPTSVFASSGGSASSAAVVLRVVTAYSVDSPWQEAADVANTAFHRLLCRIASESHLAEITQRVAAAHGLNLTSTDWALDTDMGPNKFTAAVRQDLALDNEEVAATLRYGIMVKDQRGLTALVADICLSPSEALDVKWLPLELDEIKDLLTAALSTVSEPGSDQALASVFDEEVPPPRAAIEFHLGTPTGANTRPNRTLAESVNLAPLGPPNRSANQNLHGAVGADGDLRIDTDERRRYLAAWALGQMAATGWGFLDAPQYLQTATPQ